MLVEAAGVLFAAGTGYLWLRHMRGPTPRQRRLSAAELEHAFVTAREQVPQRRYRTMDDAGRAKLARERRRIEDAVAQLRAEGFTELGEVLACTGDTPLAYALGLVDRDGTTCAFVTATPPSAVNLVSWTRDDWYSTITQGGMRLADPPFVHVERHPANARIADLVARHRVLAHGEAPARDLVRVTDHAGFVAELSRINAAILAWRDAQPADALLDADLRAVFGDRSQAWAHRFRAEPPRATARVRS